MKKYLILLGCCLLVVCTFMGCDPVRKLAKSDSKVDKDSAAVYYYQHKKYDQAVVLLDQLLIVLPRNDHWHQLKNYQIYCTYHLGDLMTAAFLFEDYLAQYPNSKYAEEYSYMAAYCTYQMSDPYELDQRFSYSAIEKLQLFLSRYPYAEYAEKADELISELREKLAFKAFEQGRVFQKTGRYKAAVYAYQNMMDEFPDSKYREEAQFNQMASSLKLAGISSDKKKKERYEAVFNYHKKFADKFPGSKFAKESDALKEAAQKAYDKFNAEEKKKKEEKLFLSFKSHVSLALKAGTREALTQNANSAVSYYNQLKELNPESPWLKKASKWMLKLDNARATNNKTE